MAFSELNAPIPEIKQQDKPDTLSNHILRGFVADAAPRTTTPGMEIWSEFRFRALGEKNFPRWSSTILVDGVQHTVALYAVKGELPNGTVYDHSALRCSCGLPDHKSFKDLDEEYEGCQARDQVISQRVNVYQEMLGGQELGNINKNTLLKAAIFLLDVVNKDPRAWPPSYRSDRQLIDPMADIWRAPRDRFRHGIQELADDEIVVIHGQSNPAISLAA